MSTSYCCRAKRSEAAKASQTLAYPPRPYFTSKETSAVWATDVRCSCATLQTVQQPRPVLAAQATCYLQQMRVASVLLQPHVLLH